MKEHKMKKLIQYRDIWLGIAMICIFLFHSDLYISNGVLNEIKTYGYGGVDICIFASAIGCYHSLERKSDIYEFMKRRIKRIIPTYWVFISGWSIIKIISVQIPLQSILGNFLCIQNYTGLGNDFNWYISVLFLLYILAPYFKCIVDKTKSSFKHLLIIVFLFALSVTFWNSQVYIVSISRFIIFYLGMLFAKECVDDKVLTKKNIVMYVSGSIAGIIILHFLGEHFDQYMWNYGLYWYPFIIIVPGMCIAISIISQFLENKRYVNKVINILRIVGKNSFEVYLIHILVFDLMKHPSIQGILSINQYFTFGLAIILVIIGCILLKYVTKYALALIQKIIAYL